MTSKSRTPWSKWEKLSEKATVVDTFFQECDHSFFQAPYSYDYLIQSRISIPKTCNKPLCRAMDQWLSETDVTYRSIYRPPPVKAVNFKGSLVLDDNHRISGPYCYDEWLHYSWNCWDSFHEFQSKSAEFTDQNQHELWSNLRFRHTGDFVAGNYNFYSPITMLMARMFPTDDGRHGAYANVHSGVDLWQNLKPIDVKEAVKFRQNGKIFNISYPHYSNAFIRGKTSINIISERAIRKEQLFNLKNRKKKSKGKLSSMIFDSDTSIPEDEKHLAYWYPLTKQVPFRLIEKSISKGAKRVKKEAIEQAIFENNPDHMVEYKDQIISCLTEFFEAGSIKLMPRGYKPMQSAQLIMANATNPNKKTRPCFDGGAIKLTEAFKMPCKLEGLPHILNLLKKLDKMCKLDDTKGFHLLLLHPESRVLCCFEFEGRYIMYYALPFGERISPYSFQIANLIPVNYARLHGILVTLYLDDRLVCEPALSDTNQIDPNLGYNTFLVVLLIIASGGFINLQKSNFCPTTQDEFLGMNLNTESCVISIPPAKWEKITNKLKHWITKDIIPLSELEIIRGELCSFILATKYLKIYIRAQTQLIKECEEKFPGTPHFFYKDEPITITPRLRKEWAEWLNAKVVETSRCWLPARITRTRVFMLHTDASLAQLGAVLFDNMISLGELKLPFSEIFSGFTIVQKEMLAIYFALVHFSTFLKNAYIILFCDNQQACHAFGLEGSRNEIVNNILIQIYETLKKLNSDIRVVWIPTHLEIGDRPSREVELSEEFIPIPLFQIIQSTLSFKLEVDCMATFMNNKCDYFIDRRNTNIPHKGRIGVDFLNTDPKILENKNLYIFPPKVALELVTSLIFDQYRNNNFCLVFHQWTELPLGIERLLTLKNTKVVTLTVQQPITFVPSEAKQTLEYEFRGQKRIYKFNGKPNIRPKATKMLVHTI